MNCGSCWVAKRTKNCSKHGLVPIKLDPQPPKLIAKWLFANEKVYLIPEHLAVVYHTDFAGLSQLAQANPFTSVSVGCACVDHKHCFINVIGLRKGFW